jgi:putative transposase
MDVRSQKIVGWWLSESESALTTLFSFSAALADHNHTPAYWHVDPGSGFVARMHTDEVSGFLARFSITAMNALPGNAKGKGLVERSFGIFEERVGKRFETYCGHCRTDDALSRLAMRIKRGELRLPGFVEYAEAVRSFVKTWNAETHSALAGTTPDQLWAGLERVPLEVPASAVVRPREKRIARRGGVQLHNRLYRGGVLAHFEERPVLVEYSLTQDATVNLLDLEGRYLGEAQLVEKTPWLPESRIAEAQMTRLSGQQKRLQRRLDELQARARPALTHQEHLQVLDGFGEASLPPQKNEAQGLPPLDLLDTDY